MKKISLRSIGFTAAGFAVSLACLCAVTPASSATPAPGVAAPAATPATPPLAVAHVPGFEDLAQRLLPTVVNVSTTASVDASADNALPPMPQFPPGSPFEQFFKDFYDHYQNGQQPQQKEKIYSLGSGFIIDAQHGYIVTNNHVIKDAEQIKVTLSDNTTLDAKLVGADPKTDLAVLQIKPPHPLTAAVWGDSDTARIGAWVLTIGDPFGLGGTVTAGIVSARQRNIDEGPYDEFIQTDAPINRGNSGGPMFDEQGQVIGIDTAIYSPSGGSVGIGFAIPSNLARNIVAQLIAHGKVKRAWLGVRIQSVTPEIAQTLGLPAAEGALVSSVFPKGPAEKAGLKSGDVILKFNGQAVKEMRQLPLMVAEAPVGKDASIDAWRKGKEKTFLVDLAEMSPETENGKTPAQKEAPQAKPEILTVKSLGLGLAALTPDMRGTYKVPKDVKGAVVMNVDPNSDAAGKGIETGDVISEVDQENVASPAEAAKKIAAAEKAGNASVLLFVSHGDDMRFVALKFAKK
ncbi:MAG: DegQ family serine endoprotease [Alphaproteobacteria bacterium]|nr:DegQ family serine endoprotease [Alphaproteobacteria bacterium]